MIVTPCAKLSPASRELEKEEKKKRKEETDTRETREVRVKVRVSKLLLFACTY